MTLPFAFAHRYPQHIILALALLIAMLSRWVGEGAIAAILPLTLWLGWLSVRFPQWGGVMLPPLVLATGFLPDFSQTPTQIFIVVTSVWLASVTWHYARGWHPPRWFWPCVVGLLVLLAVNYTVAIRNDIPAAAWLRGLYPFLLLALALPWMLLPSKDMTTLWPAVAFAAGLASLLLAVEVCYTYVVYEFWQPLTADSPLAIRFFASEVGKEWIAYYAEKMPPPVPQRIGAFIPEAQGIWLPLGMVGWFLAAHAVPSARGRTLALLAAAVCLWAVSATLTRSMILCCGISIILVLGLFYLRGRAEFKRSLFLGSGLMVLFVLFTWPTHILSDFLGRTGMLLTNTLTYLSVSTTEASSNASKDIGYRVQEYHEASSNASKDIGYRVQEYQKAWQAFIRAPLTGQGFGYRLTLDMTEDKMASEKQLLTTYVHNWVMYWLMVGGIPMLICFIFALGWPFWELYHAKAMELSLRLAFAGAVAVLASYGLFFAVVRSLPYTLVMALLLGWCFTNLRAHIYR